MTGPRPGRSLAGNSFLSLVSQGMNTGQNLVLAVLAAKFSTPGEYGGWGIAFAVFVASQSLTRAIVSTPQLIRIGTSVPASAASGASLVVGVPLALLVAGVSAFMPGELRWPLLAVACALPMALMHDALRYSNIRQSRYGPLVEMDFVWLAAQCVLSSALIAMTSAATAATLTWVWGVGAAAACAWALARSRSLPQLSAGVQFLKEERRAGSLMAVEAFIGTLAANSVPIVVGVVLGLSEAGYFRGAMTIAGGMGFFIAGLTPLMTLESARRLRAGVTAERLMTAWSVAIGVASICYWGVFMMLPTGAGEAILGRSWEGAQVLLLMFAIQNIARGPYLGVPIIMRCREQFGRAVKLRLTTTWLQVAGPAIGGLLGGVSGAAWGYAGAMTVNGGQALRALQKSEAAHREKEA